MNSRFITASLLCCALLWSCGDADGDSQGDGGAGADGGAGTDGGGADDGGAAVAEVHPIDAEALHNWLDGDDKPLLINVHIPYAGEIPGTDVHIAYTDTDALADEIGDDLARPVVVYCKTGPMSAAAASDLVALGYLEIWDFTSGMSGWEAAGYTLDP